MPSDFCYECNHPERFHVNDWNGYRGIPKKDIPCTADDCGCPEFVPEPVFINVPADRIRDQIEAISRVNRISFDEARAMLRESLFPTGELSDEARELRESWFPTEAE